MPTPTKGPRLGGSPAHERLMLANLATSLFEHGRITTTQAKAKRLRPYAEKLITRAKRAAEAEGPIRDKLELANQKLREAKDAAKSSGDAKAKAALENALAEQRPLANQMGAAVRHRREILKKIRDKDVVHQLIAEIGPFFADRNGGYTRIVKTLPRKGDNAPMAVIELVKEKTVTAEAEAARKTKFAKDAKPAKQTKAEQSTVDSSAAVDADDDKATEQHPYGPGSHALLDDPNEQPDGFPIKGNADSMLYHVPGSSFYQRTVAEVWFASAEDAELAGFQLPPSQRAKADEDAVDEHTADEDADSIEDAVEGDASDA